MSDNIPAITTYMERGVHLALKKYFCPNEDMHEMRIGRFVADACDGTTVFEIQTGSLSLLRKKIQFYLENTELDVLVVHPLAQNRKILWLDGATGELARPARLSGKHEDMRDALPQLLYVKELLDEPRISFCFPMMEISEAKLLDGYGKDKKTRATSVDRIAGEIYSLNYVRSIGDVKIIAQSFLGEGEMSRDELSRALRLKGRKLWAAQKLLCEIGALTVKQDGKRLIFKKT